MNRLFVLQEAGQLATLVGFLTQNWLTCAHEGRVLAVLVTFNDTPRTEAQNRFYFKAIVSKIAEQVWVDGRRHSAEAWHEQFKRQFIGLIDLPGGGSAGMSSTGLGKKGFNDFMKAVEAYAATELGVVFD